MRGCGPEHSERIVGDPKLGHAEAPTCGDIPSHQKTGAEPVDKKPGVISGRMTLNSYRARAARCFVRVADDPPGDQSKRCVVYRE
jgi:hypothetical protein